MHFPGVPTLNLDKQLGANRGIARVSPCFLALHRDMSHDHDPYRGETEAWKSV